MAQLHEHPIRVYYPDTDAGGIVYHGQYLNFLDQGRTEYLRSVNIDMSALQQEQNLIFVVARMQLKYAKEARLDDQLSVQTELVNARSRSLEFKQVIRLQDSVVARERIGESLLEANVFVVAVNTLDHKACRIPKDLMQTMMAN